MTGGRPRVIPSAARPSRSFAGRVIPSAARPSRSIASRVIPSAARPSRSIASRVIPSAARDLRQGFTLIEILMVLAIMMLLMGMALFAFVDLGRGSKMRASTLVFRSAFNQTRQHTVTHRVRTYMVYGNVPAPLAAPGSPPQRSYYYLSNAVDGVMGTTNFFAEGVVLSNSPAYGTPVFGPWSIGFRLDGSAIDVASTADWTGDQRTIVLYEAGRAANFISSTVQVFRLTGTIQKSE
jgi:prepilin-type N-terminal cleavage/methylation domain-containing protein